MHRIALLFVLASCLAFGPKVTPSPLERILPFQGHLYENGQAVNGLRSFTFSIDDGSVDWAETHTNVEVNAGLYHVELGSYNPFPDNLFKAQGWHDLVIEVNGTILDTVKVYKPIETDPSIPDSLKDGISWIEIQGKPSVIDLDNANELQFLSRNGDTLFITGGNFVILPSTTNVGDFGLPFEIGTSDTVTQPVIASVLGNTSHVNNSVWQSFKPYVDGELTSIQLYFNNISGTAIMINIRDGEGTGAMYIHNQTFPASAFPPMTSVNIQTIPIPNISLRAGEQYTFEIIGLNGNLEFGTSGTTNPYIDGRSSIDEEIDLKFIINVQMINQYSFVVSSTGDLEAPNGRIKDKTGYLMPVGAILPFAGLAENIPEGFFLCDGTLLDKNIYTDLFEAIGNSWGDGAGDPTKFRLPDLRGAFLRGVSHNSDKDPDKNIRYRQTGGNAGNKVGSFQNNLLEKHKHSIDHNHLAIETYASGYHDHGMPFKFRRIFIGNSGTIPYLVGSTNSYGDQYRTNVSGNHKHTVNLPNYEGDSGNRGGNETRPYNAYVNYIIKY